MTLKEATRMWPVVTTVSRYLTENLELGAYYSFYFFRVENETSNIFCFQAPTRFLQVQMSWFPWFTSTVTRKFGVKMPRNSSLKDFPLKINLNFTPTPFYHFCVVKGTVLVWNMQCWQWRSFWCISSEILRSQLMQVLRTSSLSIAWSLKLSEATIWRLRSGIGRKTSNWLKAAFCVKGQKTKFSSNISNLKSFFLFDTQSLLNKYWKAVLQKIKESYSCFI